jgi:hypothetical protein
VERRREGWAEGGDCGVGIVLLHWQTTCCRFDRGQGGVGVMVMKVMKEMGEMRMMEVVEEGWWGDADGFGVIHGVSWPAAKAT